MNPSQKNIIKKDIQWTISNETYLIKNVPMVKTEDEEFYYDAQISLNLMLLKEGMEQKEIPAELDYTDFENITLE